MARRREPGPPPPESIIRAAPLPTSYPAEMLESVRERMRRDLPEGTRCPCCGQYAKIYKRKFNSSMARLLIRIVVWSRSQPSQLSQGAWFHAPSLPAIGFLRNGDMGMLENWKLVEASKEEKEDGNPKCGIYRLLHLGLAFVEGRIQIPKYIYLYRNVLLGCSDEAVWIRDAVGSKFSYDELMGEEIP